MTRFLRLSLVALALAALCSSSHAGVRYFLSTSNALPGGGVQGAPDLSGLSVGAEVDLYVWAKFDASSSSINGYSLDIAATTPGVVEAVSSEILNPEHLSRFVFQGQTFIDPLDPPEFRWPTDNPDLIAIDPQMNTNGALVYGGAYGIVTGRGIDKARGRATGNGAFDPSYDTTNQAFLVQSLKLRTLPGSEGMSTGLIMSVGQKAMGIDNSTTPVPVFFGAGTTSARHDVVGSTDGSIHATLAVAGSPARTDLFIFGGDPTGATSVPFAGVQPVDIPVGAPAGKLLIDDAWLRTGNFEVYFDLSFSEPGTDLDDVLAMLQGQNITALPGRPLGNGVAYDLRILVPGTPGTDLVMDFDFAANGLAGVSVDSVGVPEPSSFVLAGLGCVGLLAFRRRKA